MSSLCQNILPLLLSSLFSTIINGQNVNQTLEPTMPSLSPTYRPSEFPTIAPTDFPTVSIPEKEYMRISSTVPVTRLTETDIKGESEYFEILFGDAAGLDTNEVTITLDSFVIQGDPSDFYDDCNGTGVLLNYEIITDNTNDYSLIRLSLVNGEFYSRYDEGLLNVYGDTETEISSVYLCQEFIDTSILTGFEVITKNQAFPPSPSPSFEDKIWSEYLFLGFITSLLGVVWLWYLRADVDDDNIYDTETANANGVKTNSEIDRNGLANDTAVEMTNQ